MNRSQRALLEKLKFCGKEKHVYFPIKIWFVNSLGWTRKSLSDLVAGAIVQPQTAAGKRLTRLLCNIATAGVANQTSQRTDRIQLMRKHKVNLKLKLPVADQIPKHKQTPTTTWFSRVQYLLMIISSQTETTTTRVATTNGNQLRLVFFAVKLVADKRSISLANICAWLATC